MKKYLALALAIIMILAISIPAFAADPDTITVDIIEGEGDSLPSSNEIPVYVRVDSDNDGIPDSEDDDDNTPTPDRITMEISWDAMEFFYNVSWDNFAGDYTGMWSGENHINVTSRSTVAVSAEFDYTNSDESKAYTLLFDQYTDEEQGDTEPEGKHASWDNETDTLTLENPLNLELEKDEETGNAIMPWADIVVTVDSANSYVPQSEDDGAQMGYITVTIEALEGFEPVESPEWQEMPYEGISLYNHYTEEDVNFDAEIDSRANYDIGTGFSFNLLLNENDSTAYEITSIEGTYLDGYDTEATWQFEADGAITNMNSAEGTYNLKITVHDANTDETRYAYLLIKQDYID